jgi:hypothetical protein
VTWGLKTVTHPRRDRLELFKDQYANEELTMEEFEHQVDRVLRGELTRYYDPVAEILKEVYGAPDRANYKPKPKST